MKSPVNRKHRDSKAGGVQRKGIVGRGSGTATGGKNSLAQKPNPSTGRVRAQNQKG